MARLTPAEIARYHAEGWLIPKFRLPAAQTGAMRGALDALIAANPGVRPEKLVSAHIEGDNGEGVRGSARFLDLACDPEIVELVSGVIGDDVGLWGCHVFCKPAGEGYGHLGTGTGTTGRSDRSQTAPCGSRSNPRRARTAACALSRAPTSGSNCTSTCTRIAPTSR